MARKIFYSWQSDIAPSAACRSFILQDLEDAAAALGESGEIVEVDRDTQDVPGCPDIGATILSKIDAADVFVADVTIVGSTEGGRPMPNPNVLIELGYALKALGWERIILVQNTAFGAPEALPFDLRQKRTTTYASPADAEQRASERRGLQRKLEAALKACLAVAPSTVPAEVELTVTREDRGITPDRHDYGLLLLVKSVASRRIEDWELELSFPTPLLDSVTYGNKVDAESNARTTLFRVEGRRWNKPLRPGQEIPVRYGWYVDKRIYEERRELFQEVVRARVLVDGKIVAEVTKTIDELQNF